MPVCKGHLPVTETNRTGYVLGGPRERERERTVCRRSNRSRERRRGESASRGEGRGTGHSRRNEATLGIRAPQDDEFRHGLAPSAVASRATALSLPSIFPFQFLPQSSSYSLSSILATKKRDTVFCGLLGVRLLPLRLYKKYRAKIISK